MPMADASTASVKSSRESVRSTRARIHGSTREPTTSMRAARSVALPSAAPICSAVPQAVVGPPSPEAAMMRQQHQRHDREQVLDDEPSDRDLPASLSTAPAMPQCPQEHDGAGHGDREAEDERRAKAPAERQARQRPEAGRDDDLSDGAGDRDPVDTPQIVDAEMEPHAEHEQRDPDLGELQRFAGIRDEPRREGADDDAREQIPDDGGEPDRARQVARDERRAERDRDRRDEVGAVSLDEEPPQG